MVFPYKKLIKGASRHCEVTDAKAFKITQTAQYIVEINLIIKHAFLPAHGHCH
jgi:hypothetical protein